MPKRVTLDTNLIIEYWKHQAKREAVEDLIQMAGSGAIDLAVTARVHEDIPSPPLSDLIDGLADLGIVETASVTRLGYWRIGIDQLGDDRFVAFMNRLADEAPSRPGQEPDWRDWDHLHAHYLQERDVFLTWDQGILGIGSVLNSEFGIDVSTPEDFLRGFKDSHGRD